MRIALDSGSEVGQRATRILLGGSDCTSLVLLNQGWRPNDSRVSIGTDLSDIDILISDGTTPLSALIGRASVAGAPLVVWADAPRSDLGPASVPVIVGANIGSCLVDSLLTHPAASPSHDDTVTTSWTEPGTALRSGNPIAFPEPVGMSWTEQRAAGRFVAYRDDEWAAAGVMVDGPLGQRMVGVADLGAHLEALTLVAVSMASHNGAFQKGIQMATDGLSQVLDEARLLELDVAVWRSHS